MTLPDERYRAVNLTREFLFELIDPKKTPKLPKYIRQKAYTLLKHYPYSDQYELDEKTQNENRT